MNIFSGKVILLATDGSQESTRAARMAIMLAEKLGTELHVVHVGPMPEEYIDPRLSVPEPEFWNMIRERAEEEAKPKLNEQVQKIREAALPGPPTLPRVVASRSSSAVRIGFKASRTCR
jgi:nucleotide-binding universal stress UspA family protein